MIPSLSFLVLLILVLMIAASALRILNEYERGVIFRLGRVRTVGGKPEPKGPGLIFLIPIVDKLVKVSLRTVTMDVPPQDVITRDNISLKVNAVIYFRVMEPIKAIIEIETTYSLQGQVAGGRTVEFSGMLKSAPPQVTLTDFLVDRIYPVEPDAGSELVAKVGNDIVGVLPSGEGRGSSMFLGFRPRDDQSASLRRDVATWFEILMSLGAYPKIKADAPLNDNPEAISRKGPYICCSVPQRHHYRRGALPVACRKLARRVSSRRKAG